MLTRISHRLFPGPRRAACFLAALHLALAPGPGRAEKSGPPEAGARAAMEQRIRASSLEIMELIYQGRTDRAALAIEAMKGAAPDDPRPYFLRARLLREEVSDQNNSRKALKPQMKEIHELLDHSIDLAEKILARDPDSELGLLYRGWGKMFKSQLHALAFEYWSAGRQARSGKKDIDRVLANDPGHPDAQMVLGTYLYFANTLPTTLKVAGMVLGVPGGDRERGLRYLENSTRSNGLSRYDALAIYGATLFGFEGRLEEALGVFDTLITRFPDNARWLEPVAVIHLFMPDRVGTNLDEISRVVRVSGQNPDPGIRNAADRLRLYLAMTEIVAGRITEARRELEILHENPPDLPDWLRPDVDLLLAELYLMLGERGRAARVKERAEKNSDLEKELRLVLDGDAGNPSRAGLLLEVQPMARALYGGRLNEATYELGKLQGREAPFLDFYRAELELLSGGPAAAIPHLERLVNERRNGPWRLFHVLGHMRLAEAHRLGGDLDKARKVLDRLIDSFPFKDVIRYVTKARLRYYERM